MQTSQKQFTKMFTLFANILANYICQREIENLSWLFEGIFPLLVFSVRHPRVTPLMN